MKIAFDLHGTIDANPKLYAVIMRELQRMGIEVWVISGPPTEQVIGELQDLGIEHYDKVVGVVSYLVSEGHKPTKVEGENYWFEEEVWWASKADICRKNNITRLIDNEIKYAEYFLTDHFTEFYLVHHIPNGVALTFKMSQNDV